MQKQNETKKGETKMEVEIRERYVNPIRSMRQQKDHWDLYSSIKTSFDKGKAEGMAEGIAEGAKKEKLENARKMKGLNIDIQTISQVTGLSTEEVEKL